MKRHSFSYQEMGMFFGLDFGAKILNFLICFEKMLGVVGAVF